MSTNYSGNADALRDKMGLLEAYLAAEKAGDKAELSFLDALLAESREAKWLDTGPNHSWWKRWAAIDRLTHIRPRDERFPWPIQPWVWSLKESLRPTWCDNVPQVFIYGLTDRPEQRGPDGSVIRYSSADDETVLRLYWRSISERGQFGEMWGGLYDYGPIYGTMVGKFLFNKNAPGGGKPEFINVDPKCISFDRSARLNHRSARCVFISSLVEVGEIKSAIPKLAQKVEGAAVAYPSSASPSVADKTDLAKSRDTTQTTGTAPLRDYSADLKARFVEVVEVWIDLSLQPEIADLLDSGERKADEAKTLPVKQIADRQYIVITFMPNVGVINKEIVKTGLQIGSGQLWRNSESPYGLSDYHYAAGLQMAHDQVAIRGHAHRLALFAPPFVNPKNSGITRRQLSGREAPILEPTNEEVARGLRFIEVYGPNPEAMKFFAEHPMVLRRILGIDEVTSDLFMREQAASGIALLMTAMESKTRQKMRNLEPMVEDLVVTSLRVSMEELPASVHVRDEQGAVREITRERLDQINLSEFAIKTSIGKPGPLSKQARLASIQSIVQIGVFGKDPNEWPIEVKDAIIDEHDPPRKEEIKAAMRRKEAERQAMIAAAFQMQAQQAQMAQAAPVGGSAPQGPPGAALPPEATASLQQSTGMAQNAMGQM